MNLRPILVVLALVSTWMPNAIRAQEFVFVDGIAAVVGDTPIPVSRVQEELNLYQSAGNDLPTDSASLAALRQEFLERLIEEELLVQAAQRDTTLVVAEDEIQEIVDQAVRDVRSQFTNDLEFLIELQAAGFGTEAEYRTWFSERQRRDLLRARFLSSLRDKGELVALPPTDAELQEYFDQVRDQLGSRPATVTFRQIVIDPKPTVAALAAAEQLADSLRQLLLDDADFAFLARRFSDDPGTRDLGGDLGYFQRGVMHRNFEAVAFRLRPGRISMPVRTPFGIHLIEVLRVETAEIQARHILITPEITREDVNDAEELADSLVVLLANGAAWDSIARVNHDDSEQAVIDEVAVDSLPSLYSNVLAFATPGQVLGPVRLELSETLSKFAIVIFGELKPAGEITLEDVRGQLEGRVSEQNAIRRYLERLRRSSYVDVRM